MHGGWPLEALAKLLPIVKHDGAVTAGNASGVNDSATALIGASGAAAGRHALTPRARRCGRWRPIRHHGDRLSAGE